MCGLIPVVVVSLPPNSILLTRPRVMAVDTFSTHFVCCSSTSPMMFIGYIGYSTLSMSFAIGVSIGRDSISAS